MKKTTLTALTLSILSLGVAGVVIAKPHGSQMPDFEQLDTNGDGAITTSELRAIHTAKFIENDTNGDGFLDIEELTAVRGENTRRGPRFTPENVEEMAAKFIARADSNNDGILAKDEIRGPVVRHFAEADTNTDGFVDSSEIQAQMLKLAEGHEGIEKHMERTDKDGDGMISLEESNPDRSMDIFQRMDTDSDGNVTKAEWDVGIAKMREHGPRNN